MNATSQKGYTIIEVMIVLGVSAAMFIAASTAFAGRQAEVQFSQAVRDFDSRLQDIMNDVSTGYFDNPEVYQCSVNAADPSARPVITLVPPGTNPQGTSEDCVFIGKALQLAPDTDADEFAIFTILGRREINGSVANSVVDSRPTTTRLGPSGVVGVARQKLDWGLRVTKVVSGGSQYGAIGFYTTFNTSFSTSNTVSNNQSVRFDVIPGSSIGDSVVFVANDIHAISAEPTNQPITICLEKADQTKRAAIILGGNKSTATEVEFDDPAIIGSAGTCA